MHLYRFQHQLTAGTRPLGCQTNMQPVAIVSKIIVQLDCKPVRFILIICDDCDTTVNILLNLILK